jgi:hypothetical protein
MNALFGTFVRSDGGKWWTIGPTQMKYGMEVHHKDLHTAYITLLVNIYTFADSADCWCYTWQILLKSA